MVREEALREVACSASNAKYNADGQVSTESPPLKLAEHRCVADVPARAKSHFVPLPVKIRTCAIKVLHSTQASTWQQRLGAGEARGRRITRQADQSPASREKLDATRYVELVWAFSWEINGTVPSLSTESIGELQWIRGRGRYFGDAMKRTRTAVHCALVRTAVCAPKADTLAAAVQVRVID